MTMHSSDAILRGVNGGSNPFRGTSIRNFLSTQLAIPIKMNSNDATPSWHSSDAILRGVNRGSNLSRGPSNLFTF